MNFYKALNKQIFILDDFSIVPIRFEDRFKIMKWRNEQIYHLRQIKKLTRKDQNIYFKNIISDLFNQKYPNQILFSFLKNNNCIGYGGLVNINWNDKNAEISFIMNTELEESHFEEYWKKFLFLLEKIAFNEIGLNKIFTYAYDIRPLLFSTLLDFGYHEEAILTNHVLINNSFKNIRIHSKFKN